MDFVVVGGGVLVWLNLIYAAHVHKMTDEKAYLIRYHTELPQIFSVLALIIIAHLLIFAHLYLVDVEDFELSAGIFDFTFSSKFSR